MSLYSYEEVCDRCAYAEWHTPCDVCGRGVTFCHCTEDREPFVDLLRGRCEHKQAKAAEKGGPDGE